VYHTNRIFTIAYADRCKKFRDVSVRFINVLKGRIVRVEGEWVATKQSSLTVNGNKKLYPPHYA